MLTALWSGLKRKWVFGWVHEAALLALQKQLDAKSREAEEWKTLALTQAGLIERTVQRTVEVVQRVALEEPDEPAS